MLIWTLDFYILEDISFICPTVAKFESYSSRVDKEHPKALKNICSFIGGINYLLMNDFDVCFCSNVVWRSH